MKILLTSLLLILAFQISFGQELFDKFGILACEDLKMRTYNFLEALTANPLDKGYAVIHEAKNGQNPKSWYEQTIIGTSYFGGFKQGLIKVVYGEKRDKFEVFFWKISDNAEKPIYLRESIIYIVPTLIPTKPFLFGVEPEDYAVCPTFDPRIYANVLKFNPKLRGQIVIYNSSKSSRKERIEYFTNLLSKENKVPRKQFDFFFAKDKRGWYVSEFWLIPKRIKS